MATRPKGLDLSQLAKRIVDEAAGDEPQTDPPPAKDPAAVKRGQLGGRKGGVARKAATTPEERKKAALKAARARWDKVNAT